MKLLISRLWKFLLKYEKFFKVETRKSFFPKYEKFLRVSSFYLSSSESYFMKYEKIPFPEI